MRENLQRLLDRMGKLPEPTELIAKTQFSLARAQAQLLAKFPDVQGTEAERRQALQSLEQATESVVGALGRNDKAARILIEMLKAIPSSVGKVAPGEESEAGPETQAELLAEIRRLAKGSTELTEFEQKGFGVGCLTSIGIAAAAWLWFYFLLKWPWWGVALGMLGVLGVGGLVTAIVVMVGKESRVKARIRRMAERIGCDPERAVGLYTGGGGEAGSALTSLLDSDSEMRRASAESGLGVFDGGRVNKANLMALATRLKDLGDQNTAEAADQIATTLDHESATYRIAGLMALSRMSVPEARAWIETRTSSEDARERRVAGELLQGVPGSWEMLKDDYAGSPMANPPPAPPVSEAGAGNTEERMTFACSHCSKTVAARRSLIGHTVKCPACGGIIVVPDAPAG